MMTAVVLEQLGANRDQLRALEPARRAPHLLDDHTMERIKRVFGEQRDDMWRRYVWLSASDVRRLSSTGKDPSAASTLTGGDGWLCAGLRESRPVSTGPVPQPGSARGGRASTCRWTGFATGSCSR
jgi:hypothetical protein